MLPYTIAFNLVVRLRSTCKINLGLDRPILKKKEGKNMVNLVKNPDMTY